MIDMKAVGTGIRWLKIGRSGCICQQVSSENDEGAYCAANKSCPTIICCAVVGRVLRGGEI